MKFLKIAALALIVVVVLILGIGFLLPGHVHAERSIVIERSPATVFAVLEGFGRFNDWSPWAKLDPNAKYTYSGPEWGPGAAIAWEGDPKRVGKGTQTIRSTDPGKRVVVDLDFMEQGKATAAYDLIPEGNGTKVVWGFDTDLGGNPLYRWFGLMMDSMIGKDFETGLASLKGLVEGLPAGDLTGFEAELIDATPVTVAYLSTESSQDPAEIGKAIGAAYQEVGKFMAKHKLAMAGAPITINTRWDDTGYGFDAAIPVDHAPESVPEGSTVRVKETYGGKAIKTIHKGAYPRMHDTYEKLYAWTAARGYEEAAPPWDAYVTDPGNTAEEDLVTEIYLPVK